MNRAGGGPNLGVRYAYVVIFVALAMFYALVLWLTIGWSHDSRKSLAAFFTIPVSLVLLGFAASSRTFEGRFTLVLATGAFGFVPAIAIGAWERIETPIVWPAEAESGDGLLPFFVATGLLVAIAGAAPHVVQIERGLDRVVRMLAPLLVVAEVAMFALALTHARRPDPDTFMATLPEPRPIALPGEIAIGGKTLHYAYALTHRRACHVLDERNTAYTGTFDCEPATATFDEVTGMVMVRHGTMWTSSKALRPSDLAKRLAAPVGWTHLAGGGALLASIALLLASAFTRRARGAGQRDFYEARARGARFVALTIAASTALPLAAALAHGVGL